MKCAAVKVWMAMAVMMACTGLALGQNLPPGHPPMGAAGAGSGAASGGAPGMGAAMPGSMPKGHPSMEEMLAAGNVGAGTQPAATGTINITVVPGTAGGRVAPGEPVTVELYHRGSPLKKLELKVDAEGKATVANLPVTPPVQALISVKHSGLVQQVITPELGPANPTQTIQMKVYETTEEAPAWTVAMQHMIVEWLPDGSGAHVTEMISANSPIDRAWLGTKSGEKRVTMTIPLPANVDDVELGGSFDESASTVVDGKLVTGSALFPGRSEYRLSYTVPAKDGALDLKIAAPAAVGQLRVFVPADETEVSATGLTGGATMGKMRMFVAQDLAVGSTATLSVRGIKAAPVEAAAEDPTATVATPSKLSARNIAMGGAFLMVLGGTALMLMKKPKKA